MIIDDLRNAHFYLGLGSRFSQAFEFLKSLDFNALQTGRNEIEGDLLFVMRQEYETRPLEQGRWESHRVYADIQFMVEGEELMGYAPLESMNVTHPYQVDGDYALYEGQGDFIRVKQGQFAIFLPQDVHLPCIAVGDTPSAVKKVVFKVRL